MDAAVSTGAARAAAWFGFLLLALASPAGMASAKDASPAPLVATTTVLTSTANPVLIPLVGNSTATIQATITASGNPVTVGTVSFFAGATALATNVPLNASGQAAVTFNTTSATPPVLPEGANVITASYSGATGFNPSSGSLTQVVDRATQVSGNTFCNTGSITVPQAPGAASVYPSRLFVSGLSGTTQRVIMDIRGFTHPATNDVNLLLVSPTGQRFVPFAFISDASSATTNANIRLDDLAVNVLPDTGPVASGTYRPSHGPNGATITPVSFPSPAPAGPHNSPAPAGVATFGNTFSGASPNGTWSLFVVNGGGTGPAGTRRIADGWCLTIGTSSDAATTTTVAVTPSPSSLGQATTVSAQVNIATSGAPVNAQGTVTFREGGTVIAGPLNLSAGGGASFVTSSLAQGARFVEAVYSGVPGTFGTSSSQTLHYVDAATTNPSAGRFCNPTPVTFPNAIAAGSPYPTRINASGLAGALSRVTLELNGLSHQVPDDIDLMLTGPNGNSLVAFSDVGGANAVSGLTIVLDSTAASALPDATALTSGTFRPTDFQPGSDTFAVPAPISNVFSASTTTLGIAFNNSNPAGTWTLWTRNDSTGALGGGSLSGGWCLNLTMTPPQLTISKSHVGNFVRGQVGATYTVVVGSSGPGATAGTITVVDNVPTGLTITGMAGSGWTCTVGTRTCTTAAVIPAGGTLPPITVTVDVAANASSPLVNSVTVSGGGGLGATANDSTIILAPDLSLTKSSQGAPFQQGGTVTFLLSVNNISPTAALVPTTVQDTLPTGLTATSATGTNWTCTLAQPVTCTRSAAIAANSSSVITLTANIAANAPASITNTATVQNAADSNPGNNNGSAIISVAAVGPDLTIGKSTTSNFVRGGTATYTLTVQNIGNAPTSAAYTVTDTLPAGLTAGTPSGAGWNCAASTAAVASCTRSTALAAGATSSLLLPVNVLPNAPFTITNTAVVSGGGETNTGNNSGSVTALLPLLSDGFE